MRFIPTRVHGALDYLSVIALFALPRLLHWDARTTTLLTVMAASLLVVSLLTRYELGLIRVLPMPVHLIIDVLSGLLLCAAPFLILRGQPWNATTILIGMGIFDILVPILTKTHSPIEEVNRQGGQHPEPHPAA